MTSKETISAAVDNIGQAAGRARPRRLRLEDRTHLATAIELTNAVYVGPGSIWASPITWGDVGGQFPSLDDHQIGTMIVREFENLARRGQLAYPNWRHHGGERSAVHWTYPPIDQIRAELAGRNLSCVCDLELPCHADVLLRIANT